MSRLVRIFAVVTVTLTVLLAAAPAHAAFPGRNGRIAFAQDRGNGSEIFTMKPDGTGRRKLTHDPGAWFPSWSPDGTQIVFQVNVSGEICGSIELMNADGSDPVDLSSAGPRLTKLCAEGPSFTPDGRRIVFEGGARSLPDTIWSINLKGKDLRKVLRPHAVDRLVPGDKTFKSPRMSPDGRTLLFEVAHFLGGERNEKGLFTISMNGHHLQQIVPFTYDVSIRGGDWGPRGHRIVFSDNAGYTGQAVFTEPQNVWTVRPDGTGLRQLTHYHTVPPDMGTGAGSFSPDGRWITFKHTSDGRNTLWKLRPDGSHLTRIVRSKLYFTGAVEWGPRR